MAGGKINVKINLGFSPGFSVAASQLPASPGSLQSIQGASPGHWAETENHGGEQGKKNSLKVYVSQTKAAPPKKVPVEPGRRGEMLPAGIPAVSSQSPVGFFPRRRR